MANPYAHPQWPGYDQKAMPPAMMSQFPGASYPIAQAPTAAAPQIDTSTPEYAAWYAQWVSFNEAQARAQMYYHQQQQSQMKQQQQQIQMQMQQLQSLQAGGPPGLPSAPPGLSFPPGLAPPQTITAPGTSPLTKPDVMKAKAAQFLPSSKNKPMYIAVKSQPPAQVFQEAQKAEKDKEEEAEQQPKWPQSLKNFVTRVFTSCDKDKRNEAELYLKNLISTCNAKKALHDTDWDSMELPSFCKVETEPASTAHSNPLPHSPNLTKKRKQAQANTEEEEEDSSLAHLPPHIRKEEIERRELRLRRFKEAESARKAEAAKKEFEKNRAREMMLKAGAEGNPDVIDWDEHTIVGVCTKLEKNYLRLTSAPDPSTVRPLRILEQTLKLLGQKWKDEQNYTYICDQFKSLRQDLTVQRIKNAFTVKVYESHARIALEKGDIGEYNQCQAQLKELYRLGLPGCVDEFLGYRILYFVYTRNRTDQVKIISDLTDTQKSGAGVRHALEVRKAVASGDYHRFFKLYVTAPSMSGYLMDLFVELERFKALRIICRAYRPELSVEFFAEELGFVETTFQEGVVRCREWLETSGAPFVAGKKKSQIDCKRAAPIFGAKVQEITTKGVDIKGQIY